MSGVTVVYAYRVGAVIDVSFKCRLEFEQQCEVRVLINVEEDGERFGERKLAPKLFKERPALGPFSRCGWRCSFGCAWRRRHERYLRPLLDRDFRRLGNGSR